MLAAGFEIWAITLSICKSYQLLSILRIMPPYIHTLMCSHVHMIRIFIHIFSHRIVHTHVYTFVGRIVLPYLQGMSKGAETLRHVASVLEVLARRLDTLEATSGLDVALHQ